MYIIYGSNGSVSLSVKDKKDIFLSFQDRTKTVDKNGEQVHPTSSMELSTSDCYDIYNALMNDGSAVLARDIKDKTPSVRKLMKVSKNEGQETFFVTYNVTINNNKEFSASLSVNRPTSQVFARALLMAVDTVLKSCLDI